MMRIVLFMFVAAFLVSGCSVKEDRVNCPCRLSLDLSNVDTAVFRSLNLLATMDGETIFQDVLEPGNLDSEYVRDVPHGRVRINVWAGAENRVETRHGVVIPYGCECPPVFMHSFVADTRGESCHEVVALNKNHCRLTIVMDGVSEIPYSLTLKGNVDGYDLDGRPSAGEFACVAYPGSGGDSQTLLPRQTDSSLVMEVDDGTAVLKTFAIGEYMAASGYDWDAPELNDMTVVLDFYVTGIRIEIQEWDKEYVYDITM